MKPKCKKILFIFIIIIFILTISFISYKKSLKKYNSGVVPVSVINDERKNQIKIDNNNDIKKDIKEKNEITSNKENKIKENNLTENQVLNNNDLDKDIEITTKEEYVKYITESSDKFSNILNDFNIKTMSIEKEYEDMYINETSILLEELNIPNGCITILKDNDINKTTQLFLSLSNSYNSTSWGEMLNINIVAQNNLIEEFKLNDYPELEQVVNNFCDADFYTKDLEADINFLLMSDNENISKLDYNVSKNYMDDKVNIMISIYTKNGDFKMATK